MKDSSDTIRNRTRDLPACSAVPQPTAPPCAPLQYYSFTLFSQERSVTIEIYNRGHSQEFL